MSDPLDETGQEQWKRVCGRARPLRTGHSRVVREVILGGEDQPAADLVCSGTLRLLKWKNGKRRPVRCLQLTGPNRVSGGRLGMVTKQAEGEIHEPEETHHQWRGAGP